MMMMAVETTDDHAALCDRVEAFLRAQDAEWFMTGGFSAWMRGFTKNELRAYKEVMSRNNHWRLYDLLESLASIVRSLEHARDLKDTPVSPSIFDTVLAILDALQGTALVDYASKVIIGDSQYLHALLNVIELNSTWEVPKLWTEALGAVQAVIADSCANTRRFEQLDGVAVVAKHILLHRSRPQIVKYKALEFVSAYLRAEDKNVDFAHCGSANSLERKKAIVERCLGRSFLDVIERQRGGQPQQ